jgi:hypothetical protein
VLGGRLLRGLGEISWWECVCLSIRSEAPRRIRSGSARSQAEREGGSVVQIEFIEGNLRSQAVLSWFLPIDNKDPVKASTRALARLSRAYPALLFSVAVLCSSSIQLLAESGRQP